MHGAVAQGGDVPLVDVADGVVVVEIRGALGEDMIYPRAEQAGGAEAEEAGELVGDEGEEAVEEEQDDHHPFEEGVAQDLWERFDGLLEEPLGCFDRHVSISIDRQTQRNRIPQGWIMLEKDRFRRGIGS